MASALERLNNLEVELTEEKTKIKDLARKDAATLAEWNATDDPELSKELMNENVKLHDSLLAEGSRVAELRSQIHSLEGDVKEQEFDGFCDTQVERELATDVDEPVE